MEGLPNEFGWKIMGDKIANGLGIQSATQKMWGPSNLKRVVELGPNLFQFFFVKEEERNRVYNNRPWQVDNQLLVLRRWRKGWKGMQITSNLRG